MRSLEVVTSDTLEVLKKDNFPNTIILRGIRSAKDVPDSLVDFVTLTLQGLEDTFAIAFSVHQGDKILNGYTILIGYRDNQLEIPYKSWGYLLYQKGITIKEG